MVKTQYQEGQLGMFRPESTWRQPTELPDLRGRPIVAIDTEGKDDGLKRGLGPGWALGMNQVYGVSWAADGTKGYAPMRHPETDNFPVENVLRWVDDIFKSGTRVVFHNGPYDVGGLESEGVSTPVLMEDTSAAAVMLDENHRSYSLDACLEREGLPLKSKRTLTEAVKAYGGKPDKPAAWLYLLPAKYVGEYAEDDAARTLDLWNLYEPRLREDGVWDAYRLEMDLIPVVVAMRRRGIRIDVDRAEQVARAFRQRVDVLLGVATDRLSHVTGGRRVTIEDLRSPQWLARAFTAESLKFPRTPKSGQGSFSKEWMEKSDHWLPKLVVEARHYEDAASKQVENFLLSYVHRGRIHAEVHSFRTDAGGTRSHRFSYSNPALQQMERPSKGGGTTDEPWDFSGGIGGAIRSLFLPEKGELWGSCDLASQEPRLAVHFGVLCKTPGATGIAEAYNTDPRTDYHQMVANMTGLPRDRAKILNLAMTYGRGAASTAAELNLSMDEAKALLEQYHSRLPYIKPLEEMCKNKASQRGYIRLIDGARVHYPHWEGPFLDAEARHDAQMTGHRLDPCPLEEAKRRQRTPGHPWAGKRLRRADTRKAMNNLIQGSAARQTKMAMKRIWNEGVTPLLQIHDEIAYSCPDERIAGVVAEAMINAVKLKVPVVVDNEFGDSWSTAKLNFKDAWEKYVSNSAQ